ncbi:hypothetical protein Q5P01_004634 [Channa striata]|uniref:Uncharacterized protein n=1 Tax=Channa striata TaxID=64152 RepID=A0AA88NBK1_CHASR|nr:hypothetical protein Q5P01_004634 [Channa striata]
MNTSQALCSASATFKTLSQVHESLSCQVTRASGRTEKFTFEKETPPGWWHHVVGPVCLAALVITVVTVVLVRRSRNKGNKSQMDENTAEADDGVSYVSISHTNKSSNTDQVWGGGDTVTYSTVKPHSSLTDPNNLYAAVN